MNIKEFKEYARLRLGSSRERPELRFLISALLAQLAGVPNYWYHTREDYVISSHAEETLLQAVDQAALGKPLQYILGWVPFGDCRIRVDQRVLIPRPETEEMWHRAKNIPGIVLDACTGSGCLAIALKKKRPETPVYAFDISRDALDLAAENAALNGVDVRFFRADLSDLSQVEKNAMSAGLEKHSLGLLIANPPYVTEKEKQEMSREVLCFEPHQALFVPDHDPLYHYRQLAILGRHYLKSGGKFLAEINQAYGREIRLLIRKEGYRDIQVHKDLNEKKRFIKAMWVQ